MTDHQQAAIEAANRELRDYSAVCYCPGSPEYVDSLDKIDEGDAAERAIAAAEPHLRKKWAAEVREKVNPPDVDYSHEWRRGFTVGAIKAARFVEGAGE